MPRSNRPDHLEIVSRLADGEETTTSLPPLPPLSVRKLGFRDQGAGPAEHAFASLKLVLRSRTGSSSATSIDTAPLTLRVRGPEQACKQTFRSQIDGSVQYYALVPARPVGEPNGGTGRTSARGWC